MYCFFFFFKQKTAYEMRISDWSSDVCSSDLVEFAIGQAAASHLDREVVGARRTTRADQLTDRLPFGIEALGCHAGRIFRFCSSPRSSTNICSVSTQDRKSVV